MALSQAAALAEPSSVGFSTLYRAVWRWHFIAGLLVCPFLILLAVTGALYLFSEEIDGIVYRSWTQVAPRSAPPLPRATLIEHVEHQGYGVLQFVQASAPDTAVRMTVRTPGGESRTAFVDPYDARVLGVTRYGGVMQIVRKLHSLQYFGSYASWLVEAAAGWAIVLVATGVVLWWPRGRKGGVVTVRGTLRERRFWRDLHAVTGLFAGALILFLAITGMPWSDVWGGWVQGWTSAKGLGRPEPPAEVVPQWALEQGVVPQAANAAPAATHHGPQGSAKETGAKVPWALEQVAPPEAQPQAGRPMIDVDRAIASLDAARLPRPYGVMLPLGPRGAYVGSYSPAKAEGARVVYIDPYDGHVLDDVGFARFGNAAQVIEWGIGVHQGQEYGAINRYLMLAGCIAIVVLAVAALAMWWMRRRPGTLGVPPDPGDARITFGLLAVIVPIGVFYPLVGLSLLAALAIEGVLIVAGRMRNRA